MFVIKKIVSAFILPPGLFIILLAGVGVILVVRRRTASGIFNLMVAALIWSLASVPVADRIMASLEEPYLRTKKPAGDVIILLGGGINEGAPDYSGTGAPSPEMLSRIVTAVRLQKHLAVPVIVSGGRVYQNVNSEAGIAKRFLTDLGVSNEDIILEERSRDTSENARFTLEICRARDFRQPILLTSAYHLRRAVSLFNRAGHEVTAYPANFVTAPNRRLGWQDLLPSAASLRTTSRALHEYLGLLYYRLIPVIE